MLIRLAAVVRSDKERWRAQKWAKDGKIEHSRSPSGKIIVFTEEQAAACRQKLGHS